MASQDQQMNISQVDSTNTVHNLDSHVIEVTNAPLQVKDAFTEVTYRVRSSKKDKVVETKSEKPVDQKSETKSEKPIEINTNHMNDFPAIGVKLTREQEKDIILHNRKPNISVAIPIQSAHHRTRAFETVSDKEKIAKALVRTKACRCVTDGATDEGIFGICYRDHCTFAHSMDELQAPPCQFDDNCRFKNGRRNLATGDIIPDSECKFLHSTETIAEWMKRARITPPKIPTTSEKSRQPKPPDNSNPTVIISENFSNMSITPPTSVSNMSITPPTSVSKKSITPPTSVSKKSITPSPYKQKIGSSKWDERPHGISSSRPIHTKKLIKKVYDNYSDSSDSDSHSSSSDSYSSSSDSSDCEPTKKRIRTRKSSTTKFNKESVMHIIKVPTNELAEIAIKAAFDRGVYNIQVTVG
jgi:hypothetical protein